MSFGQLLRELRVSAGLSQEALAELAHMSAGGISVLERGARRAPLRDTLELLATALDLSPTQREEFEAAARRAGNSRRRRTQAASLGRKRHNLPFALTSFVGRERSVASLRRDMTEHRLVTLSGAGGVGKTRLAIETAHGLVENFRDGVWLVELASLTDPDVAEQRIAETLSVAVPSDVPASGSWMKRLVESELLLVLDNCEHLLPSSAAIAKQLLELCPAVRVLATSREPLRITGERVIRLAPLAETAAIELFLDRAQSAAPEFAVPETGSADMEHLRTICEQLDGIPFAIELAAARSSSLSLKALADHIGERLKLLRHGDRATVPRHQTMRALMDWSYGLLSAPEQRVFEDLSVFGGGASVEFATAVCAPDDVERSDVLDMLTSLVEKSLLVVDFDEPEPRYGMLEISREYAQEKLAARGDLDRVAHRHAKAYLALAERIEDKWSTSPDRAWLAQARAELENWRIAANWSLGEGHDVLTGQRLVGALHGVFNTFAVAAGRRLSRMALDLVAETTPRDVVAKLEYTAALIALLAGELNVALECAERALAEYSALEDHRGIVKAETIAGRVLVESGKLPEGEARLLNALHLARTIDDPVLTAVAHQGLGLSRGAAGDLEAARSHVAEAMAIARAASAERIALVAGMVSAEAHYSAGDVSRAIELGTEAVKAARGLGDDFATMRALTNLAAYLLGADRYDEARDAARESLEFSLVAGGSTSVAWTLQHLALVAVLRPKSDLARAAHLFGFTDARLTALGARGDTSERVERERLQQLLERALTRTEFSDLTSAGAAMTESQATEEALAI